MPGKGNGRPVTALSLLNEQIVIANITRYSAEQLISAVIDRMEFMRVTPETFQATLEALRAEMHTAVDQLIDKAVG